MSIKLDISPTSIVIYCTDCGHWRGFAFDREDAERRGASHEERVHPDTWEFRRKVMKNNTRRADRHAADSIDDQIRSQDSRHGNLRSRVREARS
jgi:hypothetical protein